jgi:hypothetical protein
MKGKAFKSIVLVLSIVLMLVGGASAQDDGTVIPIEPGPETSLPDYIGAPAKAHPTANSGVPQDPNLAPYPFPHSHSDIWMSDTMDIAGPLGRNPVTLSTTLAAAHENSWMIQCGSMSFDSHGRLIAICFGVDEASVVLVDPDTLEMLNYYKLGVIKGPPYGEGDQKILLSTFAIYGYLDNRDLLHIVSETKKITTLEVVDTLSGPVFEPVDDGYDLSELVGDGNRISGVMMDFQGRYWINMGTSATIYVLNPKTAEAPYLDLPRVNLGEGEFTRNGLALTKEGAAYIVTTEAMYRVDAGADDQPYIVWEAPYDTIGEVRSGQYEKGSGTTPTVLGEGKYVAITDNADQMQVVVFRTDERLDPGEDRIVCEVPVFDFPGGGAGAGSNSLTGLRNSLLVQNTSDYLYDWGYEDAPARLVQPGKPGIERIDIDPNGKGCTKVWVNTEVTSNMCMKLSTRTGLIYTQDRKYDAENDVYAVYWAALDFFTGEVVWEKLAGTFAKSGLARFDNWWEPLAVGPNGSLYGTVYGGITMMRDTP